MKIGDRVFKTNPDTGEIFKGTIENIIDDIAVVIWDDGVKGKMFIDTLELLIEETPDPDSVTISRSDFHDLSMRVINPNNFRDVDEYALEIIQIVGLDIFRRLEKELFGAKAEND